MTDKENLHPRRLPVIEQCQVIAKSRLFRIEQLVLRFHNGQEAQYERLKGSHRGGVLVVALKDDDTFYLVREYAVGVEGYELMFPKGRIDGDESAEYAANRELQEEIGYAARQLTLIKSLSLAPGYIGHMTHIVLAEDLYPARLEGDEPEPLEVVPWKMSEIDQLAWRQDVTEARTIAAAYMVKSYIEQRNSGVNRGS